MQHEEIRQIRIEAKEKIRAVKQKYASHPALAQAEQIIHPKRYTMGEEIFNSISHGIGAGLAVAATVLLVLRAAFYAPAAMRGTYITSYAIFGASMFILYLCSTLYHALTPYGVKTVFQIFDHSSIYLLIAGTYTPFCLAALHGALGWTLFGIVWGLAILGITMYAVFGNRMLILSAVTYVPLGWMIIFVIKPLMRAVPHITIVFLIAGGVAYTIGCIFFALKHIKWMHCVFHLFCLAGSVLHFFAVYFMV